MLRVFLSSTTDDLGGARQQVAGQIPEGHHVVSMERFTADGRTTVERDAEKIREADVAVFLLGWRYGTRPDPGSPSYTHLELNTAHEHDVPCLVFLQEDTPALRAGSDDLAAMLRLREEASRRSASKPWATPDQLPLLVREALAEHRERPFSPTWFKQRWNEARARLGERHQPFHASIPRVERAIEAITLHDRFWRRRDHLLGQLRRHADLLLQQANNASEPWLFDLHTQGGQAASSLLDILADIEVLRPAEAPHPIRRRLDDWHTRAWDRCFTLVCERERAGDRSYLLGSYRETLVELRRATGDLDRWLLNDATGAAHPLAPREPPRRPPGSRCRRRRTPPRRPWPAGRVRSNAPRGRRGRAAPPCRSALHAACIRHGSHLGVPA